MLDSRGFDLWAGGYDASVARMEAEDAYPFAGYRDVMNRIYGRVMAGGTGSVLDLGPGTGFLTERLYREGHTVTGVDFSAEMLAVLGEKLPEARLYRYDFTRGLPPELAGERFDFVVSTYAIHHLIQNLIKIQRNRAKRFWRKTRSE